MRKVSRIPQPGETSRAVGVLQEALNEKGANPKLKIDFGFGPVTRSAVSAFQKSNGLAGTGIPGEKTMKLLGIEVESSPSTIITTGQDPDEGTPPWYRRMFAACELDDGKDWQLKSAVNLVDRGLARYLDVSKRLGFSGEYQMLFAYILGALHFKEATCSFAGVLHNGEKIIGTGAKTRLVPKGRGPFSSWEDAAVDAINLNGSRWAKLRAGSTDIGDILYAMERFNGPGYITGAGKAETSPYLWACTNINDGRGKYVRDGVFDSSAGTDEAMGAAMILKEFYKQGLFKCTGIETTPPPAIPLPDLTPYPEAAISRDIIADKILSLVQRDIDAELRETHGKNRSPRIDTFNKRTGVALGSPYCASGLWCAADDACKALGLKNPIPPTASSQAFRYSSFVPAKYIRPDGSLGKKGDFGVLQNVWDSGHGHLTIVSEDQIKQPLFETGEYNTDALTGDRDGDGAYNMTRSTIDRSMANSGKIFACFTDIPQWIFDHNIKS